MQWYIDMFALPVPTKNIPAYRRMSNRMGRIMKEFGILDYREYRGDDLHVKGMGAFPSKIKLKPGETLVTAVIGFRSREQRDQINKRIMKDPRVQDLIKESTEHPLFDMKRAVYGGFSTIVEVEA
jgi:uncharacterized protein YbaA (DUF1428 family)